MKNKKLNLNNFMNDILIFIVILICCVGGFAIYNLSDGNGTLKLSYNNKYYTNNDSLELIAGQSNVFYVEGVSKFKITINFANYNDSKIEFYATKKTNLESGNSPETYRLCDIVDTTVILNDYFRVYISENGFIVRPVFSLEEVLSKYLNGYEVSCPGAFSGFFYQINVESEDGQNITIPFKVINYPIKNFNLSEDKIIF